MNMGDFGDATPFPPQQVLGQSHAPGEQVLRRGDSKVPVIVNVTSSVPLEQLPLLSAYTASKAVNAFTESALAHSNHGCRASATYMCVRLATRLQI